MSDDLFSEADLARVHKLPTWAATLFTTARGRIASLEAELDELRAATAGEHEGTEVRLQAGDEELPLPAGSTLDFTIVGGSIECTVEGAGLKVVGSSDLAIRPLDSFSLDVRIR